MGRIIGGVLLGYLVMVAAVMATFSIAWEVGNTEAMMKAQQPVAVTILNPVIGAIGVMIGARLRRPS